MDAADVSIIVIGIGSLLSIILMSLKKIKYIRCGSCSCEQNQREQTPRPDIVGNMERMMDNIIGKTDEKNNQTHARPQAFFTPDYINTPKRTRSDGCCDSIREREEV